MSDLRFNKFFRSLGKKYWDCVSDEKIAEQFAIADKHFRPISPVFFRYCMSRIDIHAAISNQERWTAAKAIAKSDEVVTI
jgi:hypothetical protein